MRATEPKRFRRRPATIFVVVGVLWFNSLSDSTGESSNCNQLVICKWGQLTEGLVVAVCLFCCAFAFLDGARSLLLFPCNTGEPFRGCNCHM